ncbi:MAG: 4-alpha-glucanotransferase [Syntrophotaleaceae bacterium]
MQKELSGYFHQELTMPQQRTSGILLHPTSLPGPHGIGSLGSAAYRFVDFLAAAGHSLWQILPLGPTGYGDSPYSALSAFAGNPLLICLERLVEAGDLDPDDIAGIDMEEGRVNYRFAHSLKTRLLRKASQAFRNGKDRQRHQAFDKFCHEQVDWLDDYALFQALRRKFKEASWNTWPPEIRQRQPEALTFWKEELADGLREQKYAQFVFYEQWFALKRYASQQGVRLLGDMPIFVAFDSADTWSHPELFQLDQEMQPTLVAGVPPDYFSAEGQRWGNPLYRWERMAENNFAWWKSRLRWALEQTDLLRIDHFRGFDACWAIPAAEPTAINGTWQPVPGSEFFKTLIEEFGQLPLIAEDLGVITPAVEALRDQFGLPGMKILQFAFDSGSDNPYLPHNLQRRCVVYTGTHDNSTTLGWWQNLSSEAQQRVASYLGRRVPSMPWDLIHTAMTSVADICIVPLQDLLGLDDSARMNRPGQPEHNWGWRFAPGALSEGLQRRLQKLNELSGRAAKKGE